MKLGRNSVAPMVLVAIGALLFIGSAVWFIISGSTDRATSPTAQDIPYPEVSRISVRDAKAAYDIGNAIFIDTRGQSDYLLGHIPGAIVMTADEVMTRLDELDPSVWIITYCT